MNVKIRLGQRIRGWFPQEPILKAPLKMQVAGVPQNQPYQRSTLLTVWLILMLIANVLVALLYIALDSLLAINNPTIVGFFSFLEMPVWSITLFSVFSLVNVCAVVTLFKWRKWGFYTLCVSSAVGFIANLLIGVGVFAVIGFLGIIVLYFILRPQWSLLR